MSRSYKSLYSLYILVHHFEFIHKRNMKTCASLENITRKMQTHQKFQVDEQK